MRVTITCEADDPNMAAALARLDKLEARMNAAETVEKELEDDETALEAQQKADAQTLQENQTLIDQLKAAQVSPDVIAGFEATHQKFVALIRPPAAA